MFFGGVLGVYFSFLFCFCFCFCSCCFFVGGEIFAPCKFWYICLLHKDSPQLKHPDFLCQLITDRGRVEWTDGWINEWVQWMNEWVNG